MIIFLLNVYLVILFIIVKLGLVRFNLFWKCSPFIVLLLLVVGLFIPMGWGAPSGATLLGRQSVAIVPDVAGEVIEVPVQPNAPLKAGDVLFRIDPAPYEAQLKALQAQVALAELRLAQMQHLQRADTGRAFDVQQREAEVKQLRAQQDAAQWNLDKTVVRAPADGFVTNVALRKGARASNLPLSPVMAFIDTSTPYLGVTISQNDARYIAPDQMAEVTFRFLPGQIFSAKVESVLQAVSAGQTQVSGVAVTPRALEATPFVVKLILDDAGVASRLPAGSVGSAAIYTDHVVASHMVRKVLLRQEAILNYILP
ncbi:efflux RND transporter periplasmic adaptor subunit [Camelimonas sp. ID_303_24]